MNYSFIEFVIIVIYFSCYLNQNLCNYHYHSKTHKDHLDHHPNLIHILNYNVINIKVRKDNQFLI